VFSPALPRRDSRPLYRRRHAAPMVCANITVFYFFHECRVRARAYRAGVVFRRYAGRCRPRRQRFAPDARARRLPSSPQPASYARPSCSVHVFFRALQQCVYARLTAAHSATYARCTVACCTAPALKKFRAWLWHATSLEDRQQARERTPGAALPGGARAIAPR